jgi:hypothetical protein
MSTSSSDTPVTPLMRMGCTKQLITYRAAGQETVCLQSPSHGVQLLANFNPALGDVIGLDDVLETTLAHDNLSDIGNYITAVTTTIGTTLYFDPTGSGKQGVPIAVLLGVTTTVAQLVADGGVAYVPDAITLSPNGGMPFSFRPDGLETDRLAAIAPGQPPQQINDFDPSKNEVLALDRILNSTNANPDLSNLAQYVTATTAEGSTTLSLDPSGQGLDGTPFAVLNGVSITVAQLLADKALSFTATPITKTVTPGATLTLRPEGMETLVFQTASAKLGPAPLQGFSLTADDVLNLTPLLAREHVNPAPGTIGTYLSAVVSNGNTTLWLNPAGTGSGGVAIATLDGVSTTVSALMAAHALIV